MPYKSFNPKSSNAFTLMEVMVALVILALVGVMLVQVTGQSSNQSAYMKRKMLAIWVAENHLTQLQFTSMKGRTVELKDQETEQAGLTFRTSTELVKTAGGVTTLEISVFQPQTDSNSLYRLTGFLPERNRAVTNE